jgi:hypothetical protein
MRLRERFRRLSLWKKIGVIGAVASVLGLAIALLAYLRTGSETHGAFTQESGDVDGVSVQIGNAQGPVIVVQTIGREKGRTTEKNTSRQRPLGNRPAPVVTFSDGLSASVSVGMTIQVNLEKTRQLIVVYGDQAIAQDQLMDAVEGRAYAELEKHPLEWVRSHRRELADSIVEACKGDMARTFHNILALEIKDITVVRRNR